MVFVLYALMSYESLDQNGRESLHGLKLATVTATDEPQTPIRVPC